MTVWQSNLRTILSMFLLTVLCLAGMAAPGMADDMELRYRPAGVAPASRVGLGNRSGAAGPLVVALVPELVATTVTARPALYWYSDRAAGAAAEVTVVQDGVEEPLYEKTATVAADGLHRVDLGQTGVKLEPGVTYRWFVSVVVDPTQRSGDIVTGGSLQYQPLAADPATRLAAAPAAERPTILAAQGVWYDTLDEVCRLKDPGQRVRLRGALLRQAGLSDLAERDLGDIR